MAARDSARSSCAKEDSSREASPDYVVPVLLVTEVLAIGLGEFVDPYDLPETGLWNRHIFEVRDAQELIVEIANLGVDAQQLFALRSAPDDFC